MEADNPHDPQPNWRVMYRLKRGLYYEFGPQGVTHVGFVISFNEPFDFWVWLGTTTDLDWDALQGDPTVDDRIRTLVQLRR
jgi:hypothetical protein